MLSLAVRALGLVAAAALVAGGALLVLYHVAPDMAREVLASALHGVLRNFGMHVPTVVRMGLTRLVG